MMMMMMIMMMIMMMMMVCVFSLARADTFRIYIILLLRGTKYVVECIEHTPTEKKKVLIASDTASQTKFAKGDRLRYMHRTKRRTNKKKYGISNILRKRFTNLKKNNKQVKIHA